MCVEFVADIGEDHVAKDKIKRLAIFTPGPGRQKGLFPESAAFPAPAALPGAKGKGAGPDPGLLGPAEKGGRRHGKKDEDGDLGGDAASAKLKPPGVFDVRGQVKTFHDGSLSVMADKKVQAELADDAKIEISLADCSIAARGDKIHVAGQSMPGHPNLVGAQFVEITLKEPYTGGRKHGGKQVAKADKPAVKPAVAVKKGDAAEPAEEEEPAADTKKPAGAKPDAKPAAAPEKKDEPAPKSKIKLGGGDDDY
jgi:hypothetical protein